MATEKEESHFIWKGDDVQIIEPEDDGENEISAALQKEIDKIDALLQAAGYDENADNGDEEED